MSDESFEAAFVRSHTLQAVIDGPDAPARRKLRVLTGDRPTGPLHIGHYLASLRNRVVLQDKGIDSFVIIADYQVITDRDAVGDLERIVRECVLDYLAAGIDPTRTTIFTHSAVPALNQLMLPFLSLVTDAELRRNPTVKDELAATGGRPMSGLLLTYPVHQAADILFCHGNVVPIGKDNLPHVEQTRAIARRFNHRYAGGETVFAEPDALLTESPLLLGLDGTKMSKSKGNTITLAMSADETAAAVRKARTDAERTITYEPGRRPEVASLLEIASGFTGRPPAEHAAELGDSGAAGLKRVVTEAVNEGLAEHRSRRAEFAKDVAHLHQVLRDGNERARSVADATLASVRAVMRMDY